MNKLFQNSVFTNISSKIKEGAMSILSFFDEEDEPLVKSLEQKEEETMGRKSEKKTFNVKIFTERMNKVLQDPEIMQSQKEVVCAILEGVLEDSGSKYSYVQLDGEYSRLYSLERQKENNE